MFYTVFQFVTSCWTQVQQNCIENWVLDTVSKNFVILAFFWQKSALFFDQLRCDKKMLQNQ